MEEQRFTTVIRPKTGWFDLHLKEVYAYRDLIFLFVKRNFVSKYKQTVLGPAWAIIQPLLTTVVFTLVFGNIAGLAPEGVPPFLFYLFCLLHQRHGQHLCGQQRHHGKGLFPTSGHAYLHGTLGAEQSGDPVQLHADLSGLLCGHRTGGAAELVGADDSADRLAAGHAEPWLRHYHLRADHEVP